MTIEEITERCKEDPRAAAIELDALRKEVGTLREYFVTTELYFNIQDRKKEAANAAL